MKERITHPTFEVGAIIRSEDFSSRRDCFIEGHVTELLRDGSQEFPFSHYSVCVIRDVWGGTEQHPGRTGDTVAVPMQTLFDWETRLSFARAELPPPECGGRLIRTEVPMPSKKGE